jgi:MFS family permease
MIKAGRPSSGTSASQLELQQVCPTQQTAISTLFTTASVCAFVVPVFAGALTDYAGPRVALMVLTSAAALGFGLFIAGLRARAYPGLLYAACGFIGAASSMNLPMYSVANVFPGREGLGMSVLNGAFDAVSSSLLVAPLASLESESACEHVCVRGRRM